MTTAPTVSNLLNIKTANTLNDFKVRNNFISMATDK